MKWRCQDGGKRNAFITSTSSRGQPQLCYHSVAWKKEEGDIPILSEGSDIYDQLYPMDDQSVVDIEDCSVGLPAEQRGNCIG